MNDTAQSSKGYLLVLGAYLMWGVLPVYWKVMDQIPSLEILAHRVMWSFIFLLVLNLVMKGKDIFGYLKNKQTRRALYVSSLLISVNWGSYILAVNSGHTVDASLGYYINPLVSVFLGVFFFKERLSKLKLIALVLAGIGVLYLTVRYGTIPWIALVLAFSFGFYGLFKKKYAFNTMDSLMVETLMVAPIAMGYIGYLEGTGQGHVMEVTWQVDLLLLFSGIATTVPLYMFSEGAKHIPLSSVGFLQYIAPTMMLLLGIFMFKETFNEEHLVSFALIWSGLGVYTFSLLKDLRKRKKILKAA
ncbi:EamA family transporter RarD [Limibacter armeniacum]|uniref:EamA family transporter RarD n=1 Tax=Limibacter armeniacum TaxID=466084 RepID=UPI002FE61C41